MIEYNNIENRKRIGKRIKEIRKEKGITANTLAEMTGLKRANITRIELGMYSTGIDILGKIAEALDCRLDIINGCPVEQV